MIWAGIQLVILLLAVGLLLFVLLCVAMAKKLLSPERMSDGKALAVLRRMSPSDLGLGYHRLTFEVDDQQNSGHKLRLAAWWLPAPVNRGRCVLVIHGYSDAKVGGIAWAPTLLSLGWNVLAIDLRAHGESEGLYTTAGVFERHDVSQIIDQVKQQQPTLTRELAVFGVSLGAAVAAATADLRGGRDIVGVIMECPFTEYGAAAQTHAEFFRLPGPLFQKSAIRLAQRMSGADFASMAPVQLIPRLRCPLMVIHGACDMFVAPYDMDAIEAAVKQRPPELGPTVYWRCPGTHHVLALRTDPLEYAQRVGEFLEKAEAWQNRQISTNQTSDQ